MKKKIIFGLTLFSLIFICTGLYIYSNIERSLSLVNTLIILHQVEINREQLRTEIKKVQSDIFLHGTRYAKGVDNLVSNVRNIDHMIDNCFTRCHHSEVVKTELNDIKKQTSDYKLALSRITTYRANKTRLQAEFDKTYALGDALFNNVNTLTMHTQQKLKERTSNFFSDIRYTKIILYFLGVMCPILAIGMAFIFARAVSRPLSELLRATKKLKDGDFDYRIKGLKDEFGEVAKSFNLMTGALKNQLLQMQRNQRLVASGEIASNLVHEVKNPLAGIKLSIQVLAEDSKQSEEDKKVLQKVIHEVQRIDRLMKGLLNFAKPPKLKMSRLNLVDFLRDSLEFLPNYARVSVADSQKIRIKQDFADDLPKLVADPSQLQQVFLNLFLNAIDAMGGEGTLNVKVFFDAKANFIKVEVSDTGPGIKEDMLEKIFQPFVTSKEDGTGLGLAVSKRIIEQHQGSLTVTNGPGGGAKFTVRLPVGIHEILEQEDQSV